MVRKFNFQDNDLTLDVAGSTFSIDTTDVELVKRMNDFSKDAKEKAAAISDSDYSEGLKETIEFCLLSIDQILGQGASEKIFEGRKVGLFDALDVLNFIIEETKRDRAEKFNKYDSSRIKRANK